MRSEVRDLFLQTLEFAGIAGAMSVSTLPGVYFADEPEEDSYRRCCEELAWRCEKAREAGIAFGVEAHVGSVVPTPEEAERLDAYAGLHAFSGVAAAMNKTGYSGYVGIEYTWTAWENCNRVDNVTETLLMGDLIRNAWQSR